MLTLGRTANLLIENSIVLIAKIMGANNFEVAAEETVSRKLYWTHKKIISFAKKFVIKTFHSGMLEQKILA